MAINLNKLLKFLVIFLFITGMSFLIHNLIHNKDLHASTIRNQEKTNPKNHFSEPGEIIQKEVLTYDGIDSVLNTLNKVTFEELDQEYLDFSGYDQWPGRAKMKNRIFYLISGSDSLIYLVGKFKVGDFLPKDSLHYQNSGPQDENYVQYLCIDTGILHRFLDLILLLRENGYNDSFTINDGYRNPSFNERTGGVKLSQHEYGKAIDLAVGDINNDGIIYNDGTIDEDEDKMIVIGFLDNDIIKSTGGIGRYPGSNVVHFDTRGYKARWDNQ